MYLWLCPAGLSALSLLFWRCQASTGCVEHPWTWPLEMLAETMHKQPLTTAPTALERCHGPAVPGVQGMVGRISLFLLRNWVGGDWTVTEYISNSYSFTDHFPKNEGTHLPHLLQEFPFFRTRSRLLLKIYLSGRFGFEICLQKEIVKVPPRKLKESNFSWKFSEKNPTTLDVNKPVLSAEHLNESIIFQVFQKGNAVQLSSGFDPPSGILSAVRVVAPCLVLVGSNGRSLCSKLLSVRHCGEVGWPTILAQGETPVIHGHIALVLLAHWPLHCNQGFWQT